MRHIEKERYFLDVLLHSNNKSQSKVFLKHIDRDQYNSLKKIAHDVLKEAIPLTVKEYISLCKEKHFIRKLAAGKVSRTSLPGKYDILHKLVNIAIKHYDSRQQVSISPPRRVGKNKKSKFQRRKASSDSESTTSEKTESSTPQSRQNSTSSSPSITDEEEENSKGFGEREGAYEGTR